MIEFTSVITGLVLAMLMQLANSSQNWFGFILVFFTWFLLAFMLLKAIEYLHNLKK